VCVVLDEAEATRRLLEPVQTHDYALDLAAFAEELVDLLFGCVEGEVADVKRGCVEELVFERWFEVRWEVVGGSGAVVWAALFVLRW